MRLSFKLGISKTTMFFCGLIMFCLLKPYYAGATVSGEGTWENPYVVSTWSELSDKMRNEESAFIKLANDIYAGEGDTYLEVPLSNWVSLDLNGHTLSRNLTEATPKGYVIKIEGQMYIEDNSISKTGMITGGNNTEYGGGICLDGSAAYTDHTRVAFCKLFSGCISGNSAGSGGGVYVNNSWATFYIHGGSITSNISANSGGGILLNNCGQCRMEGGKICSNTAAEGGGIHSDNGLFQLCDGRISGNRAERGGGVYGSVYMEAGNIFNNVADEGGGIYAVNAPYGAGGCYAEGDIWLVGGTIEYNEGGGVFYSGLNKMSFVVSGNVLLADNYGYNGFIYDTEEYYIEVGGALTGKIGVTLKRPRKETIFAQAYNNYNEGKVSLSDLSCFFSDDGDYAVGLNEDGKAYLGNALKDEDVVIPGAVYDGTDKSSNISVSHAGSSLVKDRDYTVSFSQGGTSVSVPTTAGEYTVEVIGKGTYAGKVEKTFRIEPKEVSLSWGNNTFVYDGTEKCPAATAGGLIEGDLCEVGVTGGKTAANADGETYTATASTLSNNNYKLPEDRTKSFTISKAVVSIAWKDTAFTYDGNPHAPTAEVGGLANGDVCSAIVSGAATNVGSYTAQIDGLSGDKAANYVLPNEKTVSFIIGKAASVLTKAPVAKSDLVSSGNDQELIAAGEANGGTLYYGISDSKDVPAADSYTSKIPVAKKAGTYYTWYKVVGDANHSDIEPVMIEVTICEVTSSATNNTGETPGGTSPSGGTSTGGGGGSSSGGGGGSSSGGGGGSSSGGGSSTEDSAPVTDEKKDDPTDVKTPVSVVTENADGSKTTTTTKENADGSVTKTEVTEKTDGSTVSITTVKTPGGKMNITTDVTKANGSETTVSFEVDQKGNVTLTDFETTDRKVVIADNIETEDGKTPITVIGSNAFDGNKKVKEVTVGKNIKVIEKNAFNEKIHVIHIKSKKLKKVKKGAFSGISENAVIKISGNKKQYKKTVKLIKKSGVSDTVKFKRVKK